MHFHFFTEGQGQIPVAFKKKNDVIIKSINVQMARSA